MAASYGESFAQSSSAVLAEQRLIALVCAGQGQVTESQLVAAGLSSQRLVSETVLVPVHGGYALCEPLNYVPALVVVQWRMPGVIVGGLSAAIFHGISVAMPGPLDIVLPQAWHESLPTETPLHIMDLAPTLREYGVIAVQPMAEIAVTIPMYAPAVAVTQVLADSVYGRDRQQDCVARYVGRYGRNGVSLVEAAQRYAVVPLLEALLREAHG